MIDFTQFLVASAWAQTGSDVPMPPGGSGTSPFMSLLPLVLIFAVFYVFVIRPQQKKYDDHEKMTKALDKGDRIVTSGGIHGKIARLEGDDALIVEIADGVQVKLSRAHVHSLAAKTEPVAADNAGKKS
jgi:preprotein translocase subunit YajC